MTVHTGEQRGEDSKDHLDAYKDKATGQDHAPGSSRSSRPPQFCPVFLHLQVLEVCAGSI